MSNPAAPQLHPIAHEEFVADTLAVAEAVARSGWSPNFVVGVGRGGLVPAVFLSHALDVPMLSVDVSAKLPDFASDLLAKLATMGAAGARLLFVDDINDSGATIAELRRRLADAGGDGAIVRFAVLIDNVGSQDRVEYRARTIDRASDKRWFVFPWEAVGAQAAIVAEALSVPERLA